jgi:class 3 adenylate cyclase/Tfp pilus assembly protein PilF
MRDFKAIWVDFKKVMRRESTASLLDLADEFDELGTPLARAYANNARGTHYSRTGAYDDATRYLEQSLADFRLVDSADNDTSSLLSNLGVVYLRRGDLERAHPLFREALGGFLERRDFENAGNVSSNIGAVHSFRAEYAEALEMFERALALYDAAGSRAGTKSALGNLGSTYSGVGDYPRALEYFYRQLSMYEHDGQTLLTGNALVAIGNVHMHMGEYDQALALYHRGLEQIRESVDPYSEIGALRAIGMVLSERGDVLAALPWLRESLGVAQRIAARSEESNSLITLTISLQRSGHSNEAEALLSEHAALVNEFPLAAAHGKVVRARILMERGLHSDAYDLLLTAIDETTQKNMRDAHVLAAKELRDCAYAMRDIDLYVKWNEEHQRITEEMKGASAARRLAMQEKERALTVERERMQKHLEVLHAALPEGIAERVARGETVHDQHDMAAVMFLDIVGFTEISSHLDASGVVELLQGIFRRIDDICERHDVTPIKTIGDSYMAASLTNTEDQTPKTEDQDPVNSDVSVRMARAAVEIMHMLSEQHPDVRVRMGLHSGPVIAGVLGTKRLQYDIWGDTVNTASRMESHGEPGRVHVSQTFATSLRSVDSGRWTVNTGSDSMTNDSMTLEERGVIEVKGKGPMTTYWLS